MWTLAEAAQRNLPLKVLDCSGVTDAATFWVQYIEQVKPQGAREFGRNLDAFADALAGGPGWPDECVLQLSHSSALSEIRAGSFLQALRDIAADSDQVHVIFD
jgi:ribonuclease inhibitor